MSGTAQHVTGTGGWSRLVGLAGAAQNFDGNGRYLRSAVGGGSLPGQTQPSWAVALTSDSPDAQATTLRRANPPVIARIEDGRVFLDLRAVLPEQDSVLQRVVGEALAQP